MRDDQIQPELGTSSDQGAGRPPSSEPPTSITSTAASTGSSLVLAACQIGCMAAGLWLEPMALVVAVWTTLVSVALIVTRHVWWPMLMGQRDFKAGPLIQLWLMAVLVSLGINDTLIAIPCAVACTALSFTVFRAIQERSGTPAQADLY